MRTVPNPPKVGGLEYAILTYFNAHVLGVTVDDTAIYVCKDIGDGSKYSICSNVSVRYNAYVMSNPGKWKIHKNTDLADIPKPTVAPDINTFPNPGSFFSTVSDFIGNKINEFSDKTKNFLIEQGLKLDKWMRNGNIKKVADISAKTIKITTTIIGDGFSIASAGSLKRAIDILAINHMVEALCANNNCPTATERDRAILQSVFNYASSAGISAGDPITMLVWFNSVIWKLGVAPELDKIAKDPPDSDYEFVFQPVPLGLPDLPLTGNENLNEGLEALYWQQQEIYQYISTANISFDRYATALLNGDTISAALQLEAILYYLGQYDDALQGIANKLNSLPNLLKDAGYQDQPLDRALLDAVKKELQANGFPSDTVEFLEKIGLSSEDIELVKQSILAIDPDKLPSSSWNALNALANSYKNASTLAAIAPVALCQNVTVSANGSCQADASINNGSYAPDGNPITLSQSPPSPYGLGSTSVTLTVTDSNGASASCLATVTVVDTTPPTITSVTASPNTLWPPNHKMVPVQITAATLDNCTAAPICTITAVTSNEPVNGTGDGDTAPDWQIAGDLTVNLRAERSGTGTGRVYTVTGQCADAVGNRAPWYTTVTVPHDQGKK